MQESPIFVKTDQMVLWLVRCTQKFPKAQRFKMAKRIEDAAFAFQELIQAAATMGRPERLTEADVQLWIEEGDRPLPRKIMITSKWESGSPRYVANMEWSTEPEIDPETFVFKAPEGSTNIGFARDQAGGEDGS